MVGPVYFLISLILTAFFANYLAKSSTQTLLLRANDFSLYLIVMLILTLLVFSAPMPHMMGFTATNSLIAFVLSNLAVFAISYFISKDSNRH